jgi:hypothetical protein
LLSNSPGLSLLPGGRHPSDEKYCSQVFLIEE